MINMVYEFHKMATEHYGTEDYDPDEALHALSTMRPKQISGDLMEALRHGQVEDRADSA
jgi:hypothetical protein